MDYSLLGSSVHGILQARILEGVAISFFRRSFPPRNRDQIRVFFFRRSFPPRDQIRVFCIAGRLYTIWATKEACGGPGKKQFENQSPEAQTSSLQTSSQDNPGRGGRSLGRDPHCIPPQAEPGSLAPHDHSQACSHCADEAENVWGAWPAPEPFLQDPRTGSVPLYRQPLHPAQVHILSPQVCLGQPDPTFSCHFQALFPQSAVWVTPPVASPAVQHPSKFRTFSPLGTAL